MSNSKIINPKTLAEAFKALANPHRLAVFMRLAGCCGPGTSCDGETMKTYVGDLGKGLDIVPSTVSHHLKELRNAGLIHMGRAGQNVECWVEPDTLEMLSGFFRDVGQSNPN
jgi:ArsR family transcriptional regulator, arsenate/arsenite/antimonite-responsive transcriptional repressor